MAKKKFVLTAKTLLPLLVYLDACDDARSFVAGLPADMTFRGVYDSVPTVFNGEDVSYWIPWLFRASRYDDQDTLLACTQTLMDTLDPSFVEKHGINHPVSVRRSMIQYQEYKDRLWSARTDGDYNTSGLARTLYDLTNLVDYVHGKNTVLAVALSAEAAIDNIIRDGTHNNNVMKKFRKIVPWTKTFENHLVACGKKHKVEGFY